MGLLFLLAGIFLAVALLALLLFSSGFLHVGRGLKSGKLEPLLVGLILLAAGLGVYRYLGNMAGAGRSPSPSATPWKAERVAPYTPPPPLTGKELSQHNLEACNGNLVRIHLELEAFKRSHHTYPALLKDALRGPIKLCPAAGKDTYAASYRASAQQYTLMCEGKHHEDTGTPENYPQYLSASGVRTGKP